ncbi:hypothetical protein EBZ38_05890 [bacterium]|nr:hypothetical protein [bacterium]NDD83802.1 hypothetical protein [bacterium]
MSVVITIQGTVIEFPSSGQSPNWAPAVIEFAQAVEQALLSSVGPYDVPPQAIDITNAASSTPITALSFPTSVVRSVDIRYSIFRKTDTPSSEEIEAGSMTLAYDSVSSTWSLERDFTGNTDGKTVTFTVDSVGQVFYTSSNLAGTNYSGKLSFAAQALLQS